MLKIRELRLKRGITQVSLAEEVGVTQGTVALWEAGTAQPMADKLPKIAETLDCNIGDLFKTSAQFENEVS